MEWVWNYIMIEKYSFFLIYFWSNLQHKIHKSLQRRTTKRVQGLSLTLMARRKKGERRKKKQVKKLYMNYLSKLRGDIDRDRVI